MQSLPGNEKKELPEEFSSNDTDILFNTIENNLVKVDIYFQSMNIQVIQEHPQVNVFEFASELGKHHW